MKENNVIAQKSKAFAIRIIRMYQWLTSEKKEFLLSKQCLRSGTSIGANIAEGVKAQSTNDFIAKLHISLKEANETAYWLDLLKETEYIDTKTFESINNDCIELIKLITSILKSIKNNNNIN